jgi:hypothetical protein
MKAMIILILLSVIACVSPSTPNQDNSPCPPHQHRCLIAGQLGEQNQPACCYNIQCPTCQPERKFK